MSLFNDPSTQLAFSVFENRGVYALLLGSGVSRAAEIPTGWEITSDLVRLVAISNDVEEQADWAEWYERTENKPPDYSDLLARLAETRQERRSILNRYIEPDDEERAEGKKCPTKAHHAIADMVEQGFFKIIVTTNFDRLIENALRKKGLEPTVISSVDALKGAEPVSHASCYVFKLHGDYKDARILNTQEELASYPPQYDALLDRILDEYGLIVCGWSGDWDPALRAAIRRAPNRRYPTYWAARGELSDAAKDLARMRGARIVGIEDADGFFATLADRVATLERSQVRSPASVELLVRSVKRFVECPECRVRLSDLVADEVERVTARLDDADLSPDRVWSDEEFRRRVRIYEASTEGLAKMMGVLGRWSNDDELRLAEDAIEALLAHADRQHAGLKNYIRVRSYPALLAFTAFGLGLVRAERWQRLHELFRTRVNRRHSGPDTMLGNLFLDSWEGGSRDLWDHLKEDCKKRFAPLSNHLYEDVFLQWAEPFFGSMHGFEVAFGVFEILASISLLDEVDKAHLEETLNQGTQGHRIAVGRTFWNPQIEKRVLARISSAPQSSALLDAGFAKGDPKVLEMAIAYCQRVASRFW